MKNDKRFKWRSIVITMFICLALGACSATDDQGDLGRVKPNMMDGIGLASYESCDQLEAEVKEVFISYMESYYGYLKGQCRYSGGGDDAVDAAAEGDSGGSSETTESDGPTYTGTNNQEVGVEEADLIKTDGKYTYSIVGETLEISQVWPFDSFKKIATVQLSGVPNGLYLNDNRLVVLSVDYACDYYCDYETYSKSVDTTYVEIFDVSDPTNPVSTSVSSYKGDLIDSRMLGSKLHTAMSGKIVWPELDYHIDYNKFPVCPESGESRPSAELHSEIKRLSDKNMATIEVLNLDEIVLAPDIGSDEACRKIKRSHASFGSEIITLYSDDVADDAGASADMSVIGNRGTVYVSPGNLYMAGPAKPFYMMYFDEGYDEETIFHRFSLKGGSPEYVGSNKAKGTIIGWGYSSSNSWCYSNGQFAMSEYDGHFRIATTQFNFMDEADDASESFVTVFNIAADDMAKAGEVGGLGQGESIYAVRFDGNKGYVVTYEWVDPLYVLDLTDPSNPRVAGELKIPGFSTYLHPLDERRVIGLGYNTKTDVGFTEIDGLKIALFDVSDPSNPTEIGHRIIGSGGTYSATAMQHHAFTMDRARGLISLPLKTWKMDEEGWYTGGSKAGVVLLKVDDEGEFNTVGEIVFEDDDEYSWSDESYVLRSIIIGDDDDQGVITLTNQGTYLNLIDQEMNPVEQID